jgi:hypothetical protein
MHNETMNATVQMGIHFTAENAKAGKDRPNAEILKEKRYRIGQKSENTRISAASALSAVQDL